MIGTNRCNCGCRKFIRQTYDVVVVNSTNDGFNTISSDYVDESFEPIRCRDCGCEAGIQDGKFKSFCICIMSKKQGVNNDTN